MFNKSTEYNDFLPPWIKFPENNCQASPISSAAVRLGTPQNQKGPLSNSAWSPSSSTSLANRINQKAAQSEEYPKITILNRNVSTKDRLKSLTLLQYPQQENIQNQNAPKTNASFPSDEDEIRLLREMGWDEFQDERPLTHEEITTFKNYSYERALHRRVENSNNNQAPQSNRIDYDMFNGNVPRKATIQKLKQLLLATMGVQSEGSDDDSEED